MIQAEETKLADIRPYARNARKNEAAIDAVAESIRLFGFQQPIITDAEGVIIAGHTRMLAAKKLGLKTVPVIRRTDLTPVQIKALRLADNKTGELAGWDKNLLKKELLDIGDAFDFTGLGFDDTEYRQLTDTFNILTIDEDDYQPEFTQKSRTKPGDIIKLGRHTLVCAKPDDKLVGFILDRNKASMAITQPHAGVDCMAETLRLTAGGIYYAMPPMELGSAKARFEKAGGHWSTFIIWSHCEEFTPVLYGWQEGQKHYWCGDRNQGDVWHTVRSDCKELPVEFFARAVRNNSLPMDTVLDLCANNGTTAIACEQADRIAIMAEQDPVACDQIVQRWEKFTGKKATRK